MKDAKIISLIDSTITNYFIVKDKEREEEERLRNEELNKVNNEKNIQFHSQSINAWYMSSLEKDKSILTLSAGGIGVMITLLTTIGIDDYLTFTLFCLSIVSFLVSIFFIISVFELNKKYLTAVLKGDDTSCFAIKTKDNIAIISFLIGILFAIAIGITVAIDKISSHTSISEKHKNTIILNKELS